MNKQLVPQEVTRTVTQIGYNVTVGEETAIVPYSLNDEFGDSIKTGRLEVPKNEVSFLLETEIDSAKFEKLFEQENIKVNEN